jgi:N-acetylglucosamine-6-phosphate deacetylase
VLLRARRALLPSGLGPADVLVADGRIAAVGTGLDAPVVHEVDVLSPGFVDLHVHALDGCGTVGAGAPDVPGLSRALARRGVTSFLATTVASPLDDLLPVLVPAPTEGARCAGVHLEGPWLATGHRGAQPLEGLAAPSLTDLETLLAAGPPAMVTLAPELPGADAVLARAVEAGVVVALGHSGASYDEARAAVAAGARHVTHCFNAMRPLHHRDPGLVGAALDLPGVTVEVIADGVHLHPAVVRLVWRAVGRDRMCLVSDAVGLLAAQDAESRLPDGTLAGSGIGLDDAVRNLVAWGVPLEDALTMASTTPGRVIGQHGALVEGAAADLVVLDDDLRLGSTWVGGEVVWSR